MIKKFFGILLAVALIFSIAACGFGNSDKGSLNSSESESESKSGSESDKEIEKETIMEYDKYTLEAYVNPFWNSKYMYNETMMFVGKDDCPSMLFTAEEVISVRSYDLKTEYKEGKDYIIEDNCIKLTPDTSIPYFTEDEYYPLTYIQGSSFGCTREDKNYILFGEGDTFCKKQIAVTYRHSGRNKTPEIKDMSDRFPRSIAKLKAGMPLKVVFYGDSITTGANSSGIIGVEPYAKSFPEMIVDWLKKQYPSAEISYVNTAVGGMNTQWGIDNVSQRVNAYNPDLVFLGFGMNDPSLEPSTYKSQMHSIIDSVRNASEETEIMLFSSILPNKEVSGFFGNQYLFEKELEALADEINGVGIAPITSVHEYLLETKRYYDMTGNNVNHPNDFLARIYAQVILKALLG